MHTVPLAELTVILLCALTGLVIFSRFRVPEIVGFLLTGIIVGPSVLNLAGNTETISGLSEVGVLFLLFAVGLEFSFQRLAGIRRLVFGGGGLYVSLNIILAATFFSVAGFSLREGVFLGCLVSLSSTALVLKVLEKHRMMDGPVGAASIGILLFQDLAVVVFVLLMPLLAENAESSVFTQLTVLFWKVAIIVPAVLLIRSFLLPWIFRLISSARSQELFIIAIFTICISFAWAADGMGISMALGAFVAGLLIAESQYGYQAYASVHSFEQLFSGVFFVSIGMLFDVRYAFENLPRVAMFVGVIWFINLAGGVLAVRILGYSTRFSLTVSLVLNQIGEFAFVLIGIAVPMGIVSPETAKDFLAAGIFTMVVSPYFISRSRNISGAMLNTLESQAGGRIGSGKSDLDGHLVIIGFGLTGRCVAQAAVAANIPYIVVEMNPQSVAEERRKGERIILGDACSKYVLEKIGIKRAKAICVAISDSFGTKKIVDSIARHAPQARVMVRCKQLLEGPNLLKLGASEFVSEELEASVEIVTKLLKSFGLEDEKVAAAAEAVRRLQEQKSLAS